MAPILSKPLPPAPRTPQEAVDLAARKARPVLEGLLELVRASLVGGGQVLAEASELLNRLGSLADRLVHSSVQLLEGYCCLDLRRYARGPEPKLQGSLPILFVLMLLMMLYNAFVFAYMPAAGIALTSPTSLLFHAFVFLVLASFVQAARTDPGGIPRAKEWHMKGQPPPEVKQRKHFSNEARWCRKSEAYKPDRAHYCRVLGRGVLRMDHHCPWLGNTIGFANHKFFFLFLFYASSACGVLGISIVQLLVHATLPALTTFMLIGAEGLALLLSTILVPFLLFHTWLLAKNMTTIEFCEMMGKKGGGQGEGTFHSAYDTGLLSNVSSVMGANPLMWWAPVGGPVGDGIRFPTRDEHAAAAAIADEAAAAPPSARAVQRAQAGSGSRGTIVEVREGDPEAEHPSCSGGEDEGKDLESPAAAEGASDSSAGAGSGSEAAGKASAEGFLVWRSAAEFTDDLRVGCESIGEGLGGAVLRLAGLCVALRRRGRPVPPPPGGRLSRRLSATAARPRAVRAVRLEPGGGRPSGAASDSGHSRCSGQDFLSD